jgi:predicted NUDIX family NTP pyrophosphohydrolase
MAARSAGILLHRNLGGLEVLLVHPGGPFWAKKDEGAWSIPKGEIEPGQNALAAAEREFREETGQEVPTGERLALGEVVQAGGKRVTAWAVAGDLDPDDLVSNEFEMEWPPRSGDRRSFPEVDRAGWFSLAEANRKINPAQAELLERLAGALGAQSPDAPPDVAGSA